MDDYFVRVWVSFIWPLLTVAIPVYATIFTVNNRIKNENRENHKPYLALKKVSDIETINKYKYYLILIGKNYLQSHENIDLSKLQLSENDKDISVSLSIENIGYGVATNIKLYNLLTGTAIDGMQEKQENKNQKLFTTFDIASSFEKQVEARIVSSILDVDGVVVEDHNRILCVYKDLNNNIYSFIISINIKQTGHYDFFSYQPSSKSYKKWVLENKKQYKMIMKNYREF
ncbi:MAG: hypothetical protein HFI87_01090 [Bacilli bacterium]|nr:hypothetical protein [Bacilli bacterium]